jgi:hypothetical protein
MSTQHASGRSLIGQIIASTIRAVENQVESGRRSEDQDAKEGQFFALLDQLAPQIFGGITAQAGKNQYVFYLATLPNFRAQCDQIFAKGFGDFPSEMFNRWLYSRDLKHLFHCNGNTVVW